MPKIELNKDFGQIVKAHGYKLDLTKEYIINIKNELQEQLRIMVAVQTMGLPALKDYHKWLKDNQFNVDIPDPTNEFVSQ